MAEQRRGFSVFQIQDDVDFSRVGKSVSVKGRDGTFNQTDSVEANLLYAILQELRKKK